MNCYHCAHEIPTDTKIFRQTVCEQCGSYVHCCMNCQHYDSKAYNQCHEPAADRVLDKEKANFCDFFNMRMAAAKQDNRADEARKKLDALFKKKSE